MHVRVLSTPCSEAVGSSVHILNLSRGEINSEDADTLTA